MRQPLLVLWILTTILGVPAEAQWRLKTHRVAAPGTSAPLVRKTPGRSHIVVEMRGMPGAAVVQEWKSRGIRVVGTLPPSGLVLSTPDGADLRGSGVRWTA